MASIAGLAVLVRQGRGLGDCGESRSWLWTADGFKFFDDTTAPLCRGIGGAVPMRLWLAESTGQIR